MIGQTVNKVIASKNDKFAVGDTVLSSAGWIKVGNVDPNDEGASIMHAFPLTVKPGTVQD